MVIFEKSVANMKRRSFVVWLVCGLFALGSCGGDSSSGTGGGNGTGADGRKYLVVTPATRLVSNAGGKFQLVIASNAMWSVSGDEWLHPAEMSGEGSGLLSVVCDENGERDKREGSLVFEAEGLPSVTITVTQSDRTFTNPIGGVPDPWIVKHDGYYYLCKASGNGINLSRSDKLSVLNSTRTVWTAPADAGGVKPWNSTHIWAPELHRIDGRWYIYYTAGRPSSESGGHYYKQRSGVLRARTDDPFGEWEDMGMLYTGDAYAPGVAATAENTSYAIDLTVFESEGQLYAVWSGSPSKTGDSDQSIYIARMSDPCTISSNRVLLSRADRPWEQATGSRINEGPAILERNGKIFIVYSCNGSWTKYYRLGYLMLDAAGDPMEASGWTKSSSAVFYRCDDTSDRDGVNGVGHCSFTVSPDGTEDWIVYHVKNRNDNSYTTGRSTFIQRFGWTDEGVPDFGTPVGWGEPVVVPAGEK